MPPDLVNAVAEQIARRMPSSLKHTSVALEEFIASFDAKFLEPYVRGKGFDLARFALDVRQDGLVKTPKGVKPIFGNLYLPENLEGVLIRVKRRLEGKSKRGPLVAPVVWLAPDHFLWGRGYGMANAVGRLSDLTVVPNADRSQAAHEPGQRQRSQRRTGHEGSFSRYP